MTFTISLGTYLIPLFITIISYGVFAVYMSIPPKSQMEAIAGGVIIMFLFGIATIVSLIAWLVWALT